METLDLHPEELFDKVNKGLATSDELARVDAHLASCATCRFERQARLDFDAIGGSTADLDSLVARALSGAQATAEAPRRRRVAPMLIAAAVALMGFGSFAAVAQFTGLLPKWLGTEKDRVIDEKPPPLTPTLSPLRREREDMVPPPALVPPPEPEVVVAPAPPRHVAKKPAPPAPVELPAAPVEPDAIAILARATQARVSGEIVAAMRDFNLIITRFPGTPEAALSHAALGRLELDRGDAAAALASFDAYLASGHPLLREDAQGSRAIALQQLGRFEEERAAWEAVLHDYPQGVFAPRARTRLDSLTP
jgi:tetratricopeptide (TPR) repeat protein